MSEEPEDAVFAELRTEFYPLPDGRIYLDGHSLGLLSRSAERAVLEVLRQWRSRAVAAWLDPDTDWFHLAERVAARMAPLVGARAEDVAAGPGTTALLHQLLSTLFAPSPERKAIVIDGCAFPTDRYAVQSHLRLRGLDPGTALRVVGPGADGLLDEERLIAAMEHGVALAVLPSVVFTTGQLLDVERLAGAAREQGVRLLLDLSHSVGILPHACEDWGVDAAFWCGYKHLNGGPGGGGGLFLHPRHGEIAPGMAGWFGSDKARQFEMPFALAPARGAGRLQLGTPPLLSLAPLLGSLSLLERVTPAQVRRRSLRLTGVLIEELERLAPELRPPVVTPLQAERRGGHVTIRHPAAAPLVAALRERNVLTDCRPPDLVRLCPSPFYNTADECREAVGRLHACLRAL